MALTDPGTRRYTYADLRHFPDDRLRREIIGGDLVVTPSPVVRHQMASSNIHHHLYLYALKHGGLVLAAPMDVVLSEENVVEPDLLFLRAEHLDRVVDEHIAGPPDLLVEISSPSTRRLELVRKRNLYQAFQVPEYWYVDLEAERVEIYNLEATGYGPPRMNYSGEQIESWVLGGMTMPVHDALPRLPNTPAEA